MLYFQTLYLDWLLDFSLTFPRRCCSGYVVLAEGKKELASQVKAGENMEGSSAAGEELGVSGTQASMSQQPNAIAKSQLWSRIILAGLLCASCRK